MRCSASGDGSAYAVGAPARNTGLIRDGISDSSRDAPGLLIPCNSQRHDLHEERSTLMVLTLGLASTLDASFG